MTMRKWKIYWAWEYEAEEKWLAEMEAQGWHFKKYRFFFYEFEKGEPNKYQYRLEMLPKLPAHPDSVRYIEFMEDMGVEMVDSYLRWVYFRKPYDDAPFELYSDLESRIKHLRGLYNFLWPLLILLCMNVLNCYNLVFLDATVVGLPILTSTLVLLFAIINGMRDIKKKLTKLEQERSIRE